MDSLVRFVIFLTVLLVMLGWERLRPFRRFRQTKTRRFCINLGMMGLNFAVLRLLSGGGAIAAAQFAAAKQWGWFHQSDLHPGFEAVAGLLILDLAIYFQHYLMHVIPLFWRFHKVHHSDPGFDCTTAVRFHAVEILFSMYYKMILVILLGVPAWVVLIFEAVLNACALFNHANVRIPTAWERMIRMLLITPDMHRVHHSTVPEETNSNYGFSVPWWDRIFGSYRAQPSLGHQRMEIGIIDQATPSNPGFLDLLGLPFVSRKSVNQSANGRN